MNNPQKQLLRIKSLIDVVRGDRTKYYLQLGKLHLIGFDYVIEIWHQIEDMEEGWQNYKGYCNSNGFSKFQDIDESTFDNLKKIVSLRDVVHGNFL